MLLLACASLAGCTFGQPAPQPTPVTGCAPQTATIEWGEPSRTGEVLHGVQLYSYRGDEEIIEPTQLDSGLAATHVDDVAALGSTTEEEWRSALFELAAESGAVASDFGTPVIVSEKPFLEITNPEPGDYLVSIASQPTILPFTVDCDGLFIDGTLTAAIPSDVAAVPLRCIDDFGEADDIRTNAAREYCP